MSLITTILALVAGYGIATSIEKGKKREFNTKEETNEQLVYPKAIIQKPEHQKDVLDIMEDILHAKELDKFTLTERQEEKTKYQYLKNDILFTVVVSEEYIECRIERKGATVLEYLFDQGWDEYDKKVVSRSLLEGRNREEAMKLIEDFMYIVNTSLWDDLESNIVIIDDVKELKPVSVPTNTRQVEALDAFDGFAEMERMKKTIEVENINDEVGSAVVDIIQKIKKATADIQLLDKELDIEAKHVYDELIKKDLAKLFHSYLKLEEANRHVYKAKILDGLSRIESKISDMLQLIENKNLHEIDAILHVIKQRYED